MDTMRRNFALLVLVLVVFGCVSSTASAQLVMAGTAADHIAYGQTAQFSSTVWGGVYNTGGTVTPATYTCIRNDSSGVVFLTAGHQVALASQGNFSAIRLTNRNDVSVPTAPIQTAGSWGVHPNYGGVGSLYDVGYVTFSAGSFPGVNPVQFAPTPTPLVVGEQLKFSGYGPLLEFNGSGTGPSGVKRGGQTLVNLITAEGLGAADFTQTGGLTYRAGATSGYSGSALLDTNNFYRGEWVTSFSGFTVGTFTDASNYQVWATNIQPVPEPGSILLIAGSVLGAGYGIRRRRRARGQRRPSEGASVADRKCERRRKASREERRRKWRRKASRTEAKRYKKSRV